MGSLYIHLIIYLARYTVAAEKLDSQKEPMGSLYIHLIIYLAQYTVATKKLDSQKEPWAPYISI